MYSNLVLFDIDGTLLADNRQSIQCIDYAIRKIYGLSSIDWSQQVIGGNTDLGIVHGVLTQHGLSHELISNRINALWEFYTNHYLATVDKRKITILPGAKELVQRTLLDEKLLPGLLTGNTEATAKAKLTAAEIDGLEFGAFGQHSLQRQELPQLALERVRKITSSTFSGKQIVIIGDTPNDIACGQYADAKTIAVCTGNYNYEQLSACAPDFVFEDLSNTDAVLEAIYAG